MVLGQCSLLTVQSWDSGLGTVVLGHCSLETLRSWDGAVLGQYSLGIVVLGQGGLVTVQSWNSSRKYWDSTE